MVDDKEKVPLVRRIITSLSLIVKLLGTTGMGLQILQGFLLNRIWHWSWTFLVNQNQDLYPLVKAKQKHANWPPRNLEMTSLLKVLFCADVPGPGQLLSNEMVNKASPVQGPTVRVPRWCLGAQDLHRFTVAWFGGDAGNRWNIPYEFRWYQYISIY